MVPTIETRKPFFARLMSILEPQLTEAVELVIDCDDGEVSIGEKRQRMLELATGDYVAAADDDDTVSDSYVDEILAAIACKPDCVGFKLARYEIHAGQEPVYTGVAVHSTRYVRYRNVNQGKTWFWERTLNHLNPVKRELALQVGYKPLNSSEDTDYAKRLRPLLKTEIFVDEVLYNYFCRAPGNRVGEVTHAKRNA